MKSSKVTEKKNVLKKNISSVSKPSSVGKSSAAGKQSSAAKAKKSPEKPENKKLSAKASAPVKTDKKKSPAPVKKAAPVKADKKKSPAPVKMNSKKNTARSSGVFLIE